MKNSSLLVLLAGINFSVLADNSPFDGSWTLVSGEYVNQEGKLIQYADLNIQSIKVISDGHFSFTSMSGEKFWSAGTGKFEFNETDYSETPSFNSFGSPADKSYHFKYVLKGDEWHNKRIENGKIVEYEIWQRTK